MANKKSKAAADLAKARWRKTTAEQRKQALAHARKHRKLTAEQRSAIAKKAALARWRKKESG